MLFDRSEYEVKSNENAVDGYRVFIAINRDGNTAIALAHAHPVIAKLIADKIKELQAKKSA